MGRIGGAWWPGGGKGLVTLLIILFAAALTVSGIGRMVVTAGENLGKSDRLATISLLLSGVPDDGPPVTLLDVDDDTRRAWSATGATPHAALGVLIRLAAGGGARGLLLDFDLARDQPGLPGDPVLAEVLASYPPDAPVLMLARRIINAAASTTIATPYDDLVSGKPNIIWVTTLTDAGNDRIVRRIRLWETVCDGSSGRTYPSVALATAGAVLDEGRHRVAMEDFLDAETRRHCGHASKPPTTAWPPVPNRMVRVPFVIAHDASTPTRLRMMADGRPVAAFWRVPAHRLVAHDGEVARPAGDIDPAPFRGRIIVIGGSYSDSGDLYLTPLGVMPGAMVLANSVIQARTIVETVPASPVARAGVAIGLLILFALIARHVVPLVALLLIAVVAVMALLGLSRLFGYETAIEALASGFTGFGVFKLADLLVNLVSDFRRRGFRAVLKG